MLHDLFLLKKKYFRQPMPKISVKIVILSNLASLPPINVELASATAHQLDNIDWRCKLKRLLLALIFCHWLSEFRGLEEFLFRYPNCVFLFFNAIFTIIYHFMRSFDAQIWTYSFAIGSWWIALLILLCVTCVTCVTRVFLKNILITY